MTDDALWTVGHSTRALETFVDILRAHRIGAVADVRRFPASRRHPQYNGAALQASLAEHGIEYHGMPALGGRRRPRPDSRNTGWRNPSFRGYADYMETPAFAAAVAALKALATRRPTAVLCAEALWWQCHRALIADYLAAQGTTVLHIRDADRSEPHRYSAPAHVANGVLSYGAAQLEIGS
jgi:uncharacterized protein (DUF488 family)